LSDPGADAVLHVVRIHTRSEQVDTLLELLCGDDDALRASAWTAPDSTDAWVDAFFDTAAEADAFLARQSPHLQSLADSPPHIARLALPREDWAESWKLHFRATRVSPRIVVRPSWEALPLQPGDAEVVIDPGMSFGTGLHGTTRGCLRLLDTLLAIRPEATVADLGTGSGILAIAAKALGSPWVLACDNDPVAVQTARENARCNGVALDLRELDVLAPDAPLPEADIAIANILASVLITATARIAACVRPGGALLLSGIQPEQAESVCTAYAAAGFAVQETVLLDGWVTLHCERQTIA
jgi:ribosomal protein L11 methyltransferase